MYCQSCQTKLSARDESCPTCGRRAPGGRDLGSPSANSEASGSYPLPPALTLDEEANGKGQTQASAPAKRKAPARKERRKNLRRKTARAAAAPEPQVPDAAGFTLEPSDVCRMLALRPELIEDGLEIYSEDGREVGADYSTEVGNIDLLARDDSGGWVIVAVPDPELGKEIVSDMLQRVGWVRRHLGKSGEEVRGIVLLASLPDDLGYAAAAVADTIEFKLYQMELTLESVIV